MLKIAENNNNNSNNNNFKLKGWKGFENGVRKFGKNAIGGLKNMFMKSSKLIVPKAIAFVIGVLKFAIPVIVFLALCYYGYENYSSDTAVNTTSSYFSSTSTGGSSYRKKNVSYSSSAEIKAADAGESFYNKTGSLLLATPKDIKEIAKMYLDDLKPKMSQLASKLSDKEKIGIYYYKNIAYASGLEIGNTYEFILNTEKMNFNRIIWKSIKYDGTNDVESTLTLDNGLKKDSNTGLIYPTDSKKDLQDFAIMTRPFIQSWIIPMSMATGIAYDTNNNVLSNFVYRIVNDAYHRITIEQHEIRKIDRYKTILNTLSENVTINIYKHTYEVTEYKDVYDENGDPTGEKEPVQVTKTEYVYLADQMKELKDEVQGMYNTQRQEIGYDTVGGDEQTSEGEETEESTNKIIMQEVAIDNEYRSKDKSLFKEIRYLISNAETFDSVLKVDYDVARYAQSDVDAYLNFDTSSIVKTEDYMVVSISNEYNVVSSLTDCELYTTVAFNITAGQYETTCYKWEDKISSNKRVSRGYTIDDVRSFNTSGEIYDDLAEEHTDVYKFLGSAAYYSELDTEGKLNRIDIINANKSIYKDYIQNKEYKENVGFGRAYLSLAYDTLTKYLINLKTDYVTTIKYGNTLVANMDTTGKTDYDYSFLMEGEYAWPVPATAQINSYAGQRTIQKNGAWVTEGHGALDIGRGSGWTNYLGYTSEDAPGYMGPDVVSAADGVIKKIFRDDDKSVCPDTAQGAGYNCASGIVHFTSYGRFVMVEDDLGNNIVYGHLYHVREDLDVGDTVSRGEILGVMGTTGSSTGVHLHFEVRYQSPYWGDRIDPLSYMEILDQCIELGGCKDF